MRLKPIGFCVAIKCQLVIDKVCIRNVSDRSLEPTLSSYH